MFENWESEQFNNSRIVIFPLNFTCAEINESGVISRNSGIVLKELPSKINMAELMILNMETNPIGVSKAARYSKGRFTKVLFVLRPNVVMKL